MSHLFKRSTAGKFRPSRYGDVPKVDKGSVTVGIDLYIKKRFANLRLAAECKEIFNRIEVNVIS